MNKKFKPLVLVQEEAMNNSFMLKVISWQEKALPLYIERYGHTALQWNVLLQAWECYSLVLKMM